MPPYKFNLPTLCQLTRTQILAIEANRPIIITGPSGSGKTTVALYRLLNDVENTELITYTRLTKAKLLHSAITIHGQASYKIDSIYAWFWKKTKSSLMESIENDTVSEKLKNIKLKNIIIDNAEDMPLPFYRALVQNCESISILVDDEKILYDVDTTEYELRKIFNNNIVFELEQNFRTRFEIFNFARQFKPYSPKANDKKILDRLEAENSGGELPYLFVNQSDIERHYFLFSILKANLNKNIAVLVWNHLETDDYYNIISNFGFDCSKYHSNMSNDEKNITEENLKNIVITTFHSSKALEFDIVIMPSFERASADKNNFYYVGCTRAKDNLFIIATQIPAILKNFDNNTFETK